MTTYKSTIKTHDYYPFGWSDMTGRNWSSGVGGYRYGYQGSEKDNEISGNGNNYTTFHRALDVRLGRWWTIDPEIDILHYQSPYVSMDNNPIAFNDPDGDCIPCLEALAAALAEFAVQLGEHMILNEEPFLVAIKSLDYVKIGYEGVFAGVKSFITPPGSALAKVADKISKFEKKFSFSFADIIKDIGAEVIKDGFEMDELPDIIKKSVINEFVKAKMKNKGLTSGKAKNKIEASETRIKTAQKRLDKGKTGASSLLKQTKSNRLKARVEFIAKRITEKTIQKAASRSGNEMTKFKNSSKKDDLPKPKQEASPLVISPKF